LKVAFYEEVLLRQSFFAPIERVLMVSKALIKKNHFGISKKLKFCSSFDDSSHMMRAIKSNKGFSLIELMVVTAIIGLLVSVAVPNYQKHITKARQTLIKDALSTIITDMNACLFEEDVPFEDCRTNKGIEKKGKPKLTSSINTSKASICFDLKVIRSTSPETYFSGEGLRGCVEVDDDGEYKETYNDTKTGTSGACSKGKCN